MYIHRNPQLFNFCSSIEKPEPERQAAARSAGTTGQDAQPAASKTTRAKPQPPAASTTETRAQARPVAQHGRDQRHDQEREPEQSQSHQRQDQDQEPRPYIWYRRPRLWHRREAHRKGPRCPTGQPISATKTTGPALAIKRPAPQDRTRSAEPPASAKHQSTRQICYNSNQHTNRRESVDMERMYYL
jgi:hypothetical protein